MRAAAEMLMALGALALASSAFAQTPDPAATLNEAASSPKAQSFKEEAASFGKSFEKGLPKRPNGPVTVTADRAEWQQEGVMRYEGHVLLAVDSMEMRGDSLELKQFADGQYQARITGEPAKLSDAGGAGVPPLTAEARQLNYDARSGVVEMSGGALLTRGSDRLSGQNIRYDVNARRVQAAGGSGGQVRIVIQPPPRTAPAVTQKP